MHELGKYRSPAKPCDVALYCPACEEPFYVAEPDAEVSVAPCPHVDCQAVCVVCWSKPLGLRGRWEAVAFEAFERPPREDLLPFGFAGIVAVFLGLPVWMWLLAGGKDILLLVAGLTAPSLLLGGILSVALIHDLVNGLRRARRQLVGRRLALRRARSLETHERPY